MKSILTILEQLENSILKDAKTKPIADAVKNRNVITFYYTGPRTGRDRVKQGDRVKAEGVAIGLTKKGNLALRAWVQPPSVSRKGFAETGWRTFLLGRMKRVAILKETFDSKRPDYHEGNDNSFSVTYVTSDWTTTPEVKPETEPTTKPQNTPQAEPTQQEPTPQQAEPTVQEPEIKSTQQEPITTEPLPQEPQVEPTKQELPQPKPSSKPSKAPPRLATQEPKVKEKPSATPPTSVEPEKPETPDIEPEQNPEEDENNQLKESLKRIKRLMFS